MRALLLSLLALCAAAPAARAAELPAVIAIRGSKGKDVHIVSRQRNTVTLQLPEHRLGTVKVDVADIHSITFALPSAAQKALSLHQQGKWEGCVELLGPVITPYLDYLDLPGNNALPLAEKYAECLRQSERYAEAAAVYRRFQALPAPKTSQRATVSLAYCEVAQGRPAEARALLRTSTPTNHHDEAFGLAKLVEARAAMLETNTLGAIDAVAQGIAALPIDSPYYAECLLLSAACYAQLERDKEAGLFNTGAAEDAAYEDHRAALAPSLTNLLAVARSINRQVTNLFPDTAWSDNARQRLADLETTNTTAIAVGTSAGTKAADGPAPDPMQEEIP